MAREAASRAYASRGDGTACDRTVTGPAYTVARKAATASFAPVGGSQTRTASGRMFAMTLRRSRSPSGPDQEPASTVTRLTPLPFAAVRSRAASRPARAAGTVSYTHLRAHETRHDLV